MRELDLHSRYIYLCALLFKAPIHSLWNDFKCKYIHTSVSGCIHSLHGLMIITKNLDSNRGRRSRKIQRLDLVIVILLLFG